MNQDLEKELARYYLKDLCGSEKDEIPEATLHHNFPIMWDDLRDIARHFAKWGADHRGSSETPIDLKEAVDEYIYKAANTPGDDWITDDIRNAYIAGYKLHEANTPLPEDTVLFNKGVEEGKRLMREEAVEADVISNAYPTTIQFRTFDNRFHHGDKVHIIVIPNTDEK